MSTLSYIIYKLGSPPSSPSFPQRSLRINASRLVEDQGFVCLILDTSPLFLRPTLLFFPPFDDYFLTGKAILPLHAFYDRDESLRTCYFPLGILYFCEIAICDLSFLTYCVKTIHDILPNKMWTILPEIETRKKLFASMIFRGYNDFYEICPRIIQLAEGNKRVCGGARVCERRRLTTDLFQ